MPNLLLTLCLANAPAPAVSGVLFHASFDRWLLADQAAGRRVPLRTLGGRLVPGKLGQALRLDGNGYLEFPAGANVGAKACTVALWVRPEQWGEKTYDSIFGLTDNNVNAFHLERSNPDGRLRLVLGGPDTADGAKTRSIWSDRPLVSGEWVHVAASWDAEQGTAEMFLDGVSVAKADGLISFPQDVPSILVGCAFARLARAIRGEIDELVILDHAATAEEVTRLMAGIGGPGQITELGNGRLTASVDRAHGTVTVGAMNGGRPALFGPGRPWAKVGNNMVVWPTFVTDDPTEPIAPRLGPAEHRVFTATDDASGLELHYHLQTQREAPWCLLWSEVVNRTNAPVSIDELGVLRADGPDGFYLGDGLDRLRAFVDSGGLTGSHSADLAAPKADHAAHGALVAAEPEQDWACSFSFLTFQTGWTNNRLTFDEQAEPATASAGCNYSRGYHLEPGATLRSEVLGIGVHPTGQAALDSWTDAVMAINELQPPRFCPSGWNSWYAYRLTITEDLVLDNARIVKERFAPFGVTNLQIDHGWQDRDLVGHWVANDRFPHGLPWLAEQLHQQGQTLGLWTAVSQVSEFAPLFAERPDLLFHNDDGSPFVADANWFWEPHGKTFTLDPTSPNGEAIYRQIGEDLRSYGCSYCKNDFQGNLLHGGVVPHDPNATLGPPVWHKAMDAFAAGRGPDMAYHACNAPLNMVAGKCDVAWVHRDLGNPAGNWAHLRAWANDFATRAHVSGKFYWGDPDYLQVGQGNLDETRVRMAFVALGGGPAFICDRLPELPEERLALIPQCLPSYGPTARPLDLFTHDGYPRVWALPVETAWGKWTVVGLFNLDEQSDRIELDLSELGLTGERAAVYDYFAGELLGEVSLGGADLAVTVQVPVPAHSVRLLKLVPLQGHPFVLSTDMHLTQGGVELPAVTWDEATLTLTGTAKRAPGMKGNVLVYVPDGFGPVAAQAEGKVLAVPVSFEQTEAAWAARFERH